MAALKSSEGNIIWWNSFFSPVASELILNVLNHLAWNYVVWGRRCSVLRENRGKVRRGLRFALSNPYINICTPWPCEPLNLCRLIMSWKLDARFMHNHRKKYTCLLATKDPFPHRVHSLMVIECQQLAYLVIWSLGLWYRGHLENMRSHYEHNFLQWFTLVWV